jgi:chemosensory pili system protein ChpA (sensor histidine kinase/response regulator)
MRRTSTEAAAAFTAGRSRSILVVDADERIRERIERQLSRAGYRVVTARDAMAAVRHVLREPPDLIIADVGMRYVEGLEFLAAVRDDGGTRAVPLILLTDGDARAERGIASGAHAYLAKPLLAARLLGAVAEQLAPH